MAHHRDGDEKHTHRDHPRPHGERTREDGDRRDRRTVDPGDPVPEGLTTEGGDDGTPGDARQAKDF